MIKRMPDYLIIGTQKGGTTSLYSYIIQHPNVARANEKEVRYFSDFTSKGLNWYRAQFPSLHSGKSGIITGEATPDYIENLQIPEMVYKVMPNVKIIALLRNPIDRAYSQYQMAIRNRINMQFKDLPSFDDMVEREIHGKSGFQFLRRGVYVDKLKPWFHIFPGNQILIIKSEDFFDNPSNITNRVLDFLNLEALTSSIDYTPANEHKVNYPKMDPNTRKKLINFFLEHNKRLYQFLDRDFGWDN